MPCLTHTVGGNGAWREEPLLTIVVNHFPDNLIILAEKADETSIPEELLRRLQYVNGLQRQSK